MDVRTTFRREVKALWDDGTGLSLVAIASTWGLLTGVRMVYPVVLPYLQDTYGLSLAVAGLLVTVLWFCSSIGQLPGGVLADRYDERTLLIVSIAVVSLSLSLIATSSTALVLFAATGLWGIGQSLFPIARITILSKLYPDRLGSVLGVTMASGDIGQTVLPPAAATIAAGLAWQAGLGFVVPLLLAGALLIFVTVPAQQAGDPSDAQSWGEILGVFGELRDPTMGLVAGILFLYGFTWQTFTAFFPTYLTSIKELSPSVASLLFGSFFAMGVVVKPIAGAAYDRIGMRGSLIGVLVPPVVGFVLLPTTDAVWAILGITVLISIMLGTGTITQSYLADLFSDEMQGTGLGVIRTTTFTLAAGGPVVFGVVADYGYFDQGYLVLAAFMTIVIVLTLRMPKV